MAEAGEAGNCLAQDDGLKVSRKGEEKLKGIKKISFSALTLILILGTLANIQAHASHASTAETLSSTKGPRAEDLIIYYYGDAQSAYAALKAGQIDILGQELIRYTGPPVPPNPIDNYVWPASFGPDNLDNNGLPGRYVGTDDPYDGFGTPYWTGNFSLAYPFVSVNQINVTALPFTPGNYTYTLKEGVDYLVHADEDLVELLTPVDVPITNEHWKDGVNNSLNGWPYINHVASSIQSVYVDMNNGTARPSPNAGYAGDWTQGEWWYDPDWTWELEGWWALGYFPGPWNWPAGSDWWINYTAASYLTIDYNAGPAPIDQFSDAINDPNIVVDSVADMGMNQFDLNNNYTIHSVRGYRSPMSYVEMRRAVAWLTPKDFIVNEICGSFAERIDQQIPAPNKGWANASYWYPNYPYEYDPAAAAASLDAGGFAQGSTANPDYDPGFPGSAQFIRTYPTGHEKEGQDLDPIEVVIRTDDIRQFEAGHLVASNMRKHGIPMTVTEGDINSIYDKVFGLFDYHLYTGRWSAGRFPALGLWQLYSKESIYPYGSNYVTGINSQTHKYPRLQKLLEKARFPSSYSEAASAVKLAAGYMTEQCITVPLFSAKSYWAWSNHLLGVVNMYGYGPINPYTFMNAYRDDTPSRGPIRVGLKSAPNQMNTVYSSWIWDYICLDRMTLYGDMDVAPYDLSIDQPGFVRNWETDIWFDPVDGENKTKLTLVFRSDGYFVEPVTGTQKANVNTSHHFFNIWYDYNVDPIGWNFPDVEDIHHVVMVNNTAVQVYFDSESYWSTYYARGVFRPMDTWAQHSELVTVATESFPGWSGTGQVPLANNPCWIASIDVDGTPLAHGTDWNIVLGNLIILTSQTGTLNVEYWAPNDPRGYTPGNLPWQTVFEGAGMFFPTAFTPGVGGSLTLKRNPFYWMETPPLGEIDFIRKPNGAFAVDYSDLAILVWAYNSTGTGLPDGNWFPGADIAPPGGYVHPVFDQLTFYWNLDTVWDIPLMSVLQTDKLAQTSAPTLSNTTVRVVPEVVDLGPEPTFVIGEEFDIAVVVENVTNLYGLDLQLSWDNDYLEYVNHTVTVSTEDFPDPIPPSPYAGILHSPTFNVKNETFTDSYWFAEVSTWPAPSFNGSGTAFVMTFRVKQQLLNRSIEVPLTLNSTILATPQEEAIDHVTVDGLVRIPQAPTPVVRVEPQVVELGPEPTWVVGSEFDIAVVVEDVIDLSALILEFGWNPEYLEYVNHTATIPVEDFPSPIPPSPYAGLLTGNLILLNDTADSVRGKYNLDVATIPSTHFNGNGTAFVMTFRVKQQLEDTAVEVPLTFTSTLLVNSQIEAINHTTVDGLVRIPQAPNPLVFVDPPTTTVNQNKDFAINVSIGCGLAVHGYLFTLYYNSSFFHTSNVNEGPWLGSTTSTISDVAWNENYNATHGRIWFWAIQPNPNPGATGNGTLATVYFGASESLGVSTLHLEVELAGVRVGGARPIAHDTHDGSVTVTYAGDADGDGDVDIFDIVGIARRYNSKEGDGRYDPNYDFDADGDVDIFDIVIAAGNYGKSL